MIGKILYRSSILSYITAIALCAISCTKYPKGYLSPNIQYSVTEFSIIRGRAAVSGSLISDGSTSPLHVKLAHAYDSTGQVVDDLFTTLRPVLSWTSGYNPLVDTTYASITAKQKAVDLPPIVINETNGSIASNGGSLFIPPGTYTLDLDVSNAAGTETLKHIVQLLVQDGKAVETVPESGNIAVGKTPAGQAPVTYWFNAVNNPFVDYTVTRFADTPNIFILKLVDRNGVPFNPAAGEAIRRPNTGINPIPPYLQNLQDYSPDTYSANDTSMAIRFPVVPFPVNPLVNGYNVYYNLPSSAITIDSTSAWTDNRNGLLYAGTADPHYLGVYASGLYDYSIRIPMRIYVTGAYEMTARILNVTHK